MTHDDGYDPYTRLRNDEADEADIEARIRSAVAQERERCAQKAEAWARGETAFTTAAEAIRA